MKEKYIPGEGCQCSARCSCECGCDVDWTPREIYELREQRDRLAEALWSMLNQDDGSAIRAGILLRSLGLQSPTNPNEL
jgi:hypothetical protein